jgi:hypothetical protein
MKNLAISFAVFVSSVLSTTCYAISIGGIDVAVFADTVRSTTTGTYLNQASNGDINNTIDFAGVQAALTDSDVNTFAFTITTVYPGDAYIDMAFSTPIYNGEGNDLALFFAGDNNHFSIEINNTVLDYTPVWTPEILTVSVPMGSRNVDVNVGVSLINLDDFGLLGSADPLGDIRIFMNDSTYPELALVGGFHTSPAYTAVPLPLPALLFASGLGLLGAISRKCKPL